MNFNYIIGLEDWKNVIERIELLGVEDRVYWIFIRLVDGNVE